MRVPELDSDQWVREMAAVIAIPQPLTMEDCAWLDDLLFEARKRGREAAKLAKEDLFEDPL